jgi:hypothetical protein
MTTALEREEKRIGKGGKRGRVFLSFNAVADSS